MFALFGADLPCYHFINHSSSQTKRVPPQDLTHKLEWYQWDIVGLVEVRGTRFDETTTDVGHKVWYSEKVRHEYGVGFLVHRKVVKPVSTRLISISVSARLQNAIIVEAYAFLRSALGNDCQIRLRAYPGALLTAPTILAYLACAGS